MPGRARQPTPPPGGGSSAPVGLTPNGVPNGGTATPAGGGGLGADLSAVGAGVPGAAGAALQAAGAATSSTGLAAIADAITEAFAPLASVQKLSDLVARAWLPTNIIRVSCGLLGTFFLLFGLVLLVREVKED